MRWSVTIGRFGGTAVRIHLTFLLLLLWIGFSAWQRGGEAAALDSVLLILPLSARVVLHWRFERGRAERGPVRIGLC